MEESLAILSVCQTCMQPTHNTGTRLCDPCWQLQRSLAYARTLIAQPKHQDAVRALLNEVRAADRVALTGERLDALRRAAQLATPGTWSTGGTPTSAKYGAVVSDAFRPGHPRHDEHYGGGFIAEGFGAPDAEFVVSAQPSVILLMVRVTAAAKRWADAQRANPGDEGEASRACDLASQRLFRAVAHAFNEPAREE